MERILAAVVLGLCLFGVQCAEEQTAMVAFVCRRPAVHMTEQGWVRDDTTDCLEDPTDILNYCRKVYPDLDVRNVVESGKKHKVPGWCGFGRSTCGMNKHTYTIRPYICWVGAFQSEALLVPEHCLFDHIHKTSTCKSYQEWNATASESCISRGMVQHCFAILQPCGIDRFNGVEFVCCPTDDVDELVHKALEDATTTTTTTTTTPATTTTTTEPTPDDVQAVEQPSDGEPAPDAPTATGTYDRYIMNFQNPYENEHEYFIKAKGDLQKHHHEKITRMMKEWAAARQQVQELKAADPKGAEKLNKDITSRFQKTYEALEQEGMAEKHQLGSLHQQHIQTELNAKKRKTMENYLNTLTASNPQPADVLSAIKSYIKSEQKDRLHSVNHYKHLLDTDPAAADAARPQILDHLKIIDQRMQQALELLKRVDFHQKVLVGVQEFMQMYHSIDVSIANLLEFEESESEEDYSDEDEDVTDEDEDEDYDEDDESYEEYEDEYDEDEDDDSEEDSSEVDSLPPVDAEESSTPLPVMPDDLHLVPIDSTEVLVDSVDGVQGAGLIYDDEVMEDEHDYIDEQEIKPNHFKSSQLSAEETYMKKVPVKSHNAIHTGTPLGIAVGSITVFIVIVVGIIVIRKRAYRPAPVTGEGFVEVDQVTSPEERHVTNMQMNGYENPTYKYFETSTAP